MTYLADRLVELELRFGGMHKVNRRVVSPHAVEPAWPKMRGGDRMGAYGHGYAPFYAEHLAPFFHRSDLVIIEIGVLKGTGLAIWSKLFPEEDLIGIDIDLSNFDLAGLIERSAFDRKLPELYEADQFTMTADSMAEILKGRKVSISIDDGFHEPEPVMRTFSALLPHFADTFVHFIEDMPDIGPELKRIYPSLGIVSDGGITAVTP